MEGSSERPINYLESIVVQVSPKCAAHVQRVMHQRAVDVLLMPEIRMVCVQDLAKHCAEQLGKGEVLELFS